MNRLTTRNEMGVAVLKTPYMCDRCGEDIYRLGDYGNGEPIEKLACYEDLEEQGLLLKLPCAVGDTVYVIPTEKNSFLKITKMKCLGFSIGEPNDVANLFPINRYDTAVKMYQPGLEEFGKTVFLTREEAEAALKENRGVKDEKHEKHN